MQSNLVALVTGAAGGIGQATVRLLHTSGMQVIATDKKGLDFNDQNILNLPGVDAVDELSVKHAVMSGVERFGKINLLFNNCGVGANLDHDTKEKIVMHDTLTVTAEALAKVMGINLLSSLYFTKYAIPHMPKNDSSVI